METFELTFCLAKISFLLKTTYVVYRKIVKSFAVDLLISY